MNHLDKKTRLLVWGLVLFTFSSSAEIPDIGDRRELFVDSYMIESMDNLSLRLHEPRREEPALHFNAPWEGRYSAYATVLNDNGLFRMYYRGLPSAEKGTSAVTCYAESRDGIHWEKPSLGLFEIDGSKDNNVVLTGVDDFSRGFSPFIDTRPGIPKEERYKAVAAKSKEGLVLFVSVDGLHWNRMREGYFFTQGMFDSQNVMFWSESEACYVCYFRTWTGIGYTGIRTISRTTSTDLLNWTDPVAMDFGNTPMEHLYTNGTKPYFRAPHIYIGLAKRFFPEKAAFANDKAQAMVHDPNHGSSSSDSIFMTSRGGGTYDRTFMEAFIRPGNAEEDWVARDNTPALGLVPAANGREMYIYRMSHYGQPTSHLTRYTLRLDGFVSVHAPYQSGELVTKAFLFSGSELEINYESSAAGEIRIEMQDEQGAAIPGFSANACIPIFGNEISRVVKWSSDTDLKTLVGKTVRLRVVMKDADLYSFQFR
jgi:hypothetical protein